VRRVVLDTSVLVAAVRSDRGASRVLLVGALEREYELVLSVPLMIEYEAVLTRPEHLEAAGLSEDQAQSLLDAIALVGTPVRLAYLWRPVLDDVDDDMVLETAVNGQAHLLVTLNPADFGGADRFSVRVLSPSAAIELLEIRK
jgi:putative PIN family toxin of toxin-antitoxin system